jgi:rubrerythrin
LEEEQKLKEEEEAAAWEQIFFCWTCGDFVESKEDRLCPNCLRNYPMLDPGY